jgi:histidine ammonia-lyase
MPPIFYLGEHRLTLSTLIAAANKAHAFGWSQTGWEKIARSHQAVQTIARGNAVVYGINTGFGALAEEIISPEQTRLLQYKLLQSHSVGVGPAIEPHMVRVMLLLKLHALSLGYSGVSQQTLDRIRWFFDHDLLPLVPAQGSVGASGDLAPLAHLFLPLMGLGWVGKDHGFVPAAQVLAEHGLEPIALGPKEGLALINGTQFMAALACEAVHRLHNCLEAADVIGAMSLEALTGTRAPFDQRLHALRPFDGCQLVASRLRKLLQNSAIMQSHADCNRVQDPYSLRCMPQVHGASRNGWLHLKNVVETEINSVTDNPVIFGEKDSVSGGNFHGQPLALPLDYACLAAAELGNISDRRCYLLLEGKWGLPLLLMRNVGLNSGFMIPQYTTAALVSENKSLCFPASADSIPTSLGQEDHVSMGSISGRKLLQVIGNVENILAVELMTACQAMEFRRPLRSSPLLEFAHELVRRYVSFAEEDRVYADDIQQIAALIKSGQFMKALNDFALQNHMVLNDDYPDFIL